MSADALVRYFNRTDYLLLAISIICATIYFFSPSWIPFPGGVVIKGATVSLLAVIVARMTAGRVRLLLGAALVLSAAGDVLLALGERLFIYGLVVFLIAHLFYLALWVSYWPRPFQARFDQWALLLAVIVYAVVLSWRIWPGLGGMKWPVVAYIIVITLMVAAAALAAFTTQMVVLGAVLFLISDSLIGLSRFHQPPPYASYWIWSTYYLGQCGLALGFLRELRRSQMPVVKRPSKKRLRRKRR